MLWKVSNIKENTIQIDFFLVFESSINLVKMVIFTALYELNIFKGLNYCLELLGCCFEIRKFSKI